MEVYFTTWLMSCQRHTGKQTAVPRTRKTRILWLCKVPNLRRHARLGRPAIRESRAIRTRMRVVSNPDRAEQDAQNVHVPLPWLRFTTLTQALKVGIILVKEFMLLAQKLRITARMHGDGNIAASRISANVRAAQDEMILLPPLLLCRSRLRFARASFIQRMYQRIFRNCGGAKLVALPNRITRGGE